MSKSKISTIFLYVVAAISLLVMIFFYASPKTVDIEELDSRIEALTTAADIQETDAVPEVGTESVDSTGTADELVAGSDSAAAAPVVADEPRKEVAAVQEVDLKDHLSNWELMVYKRTDYALGWAYILLAITTIASLLFPLIYMVTNLKALLRMLALLAGAAVILLISYFVFAADTPLSIIGYTGTDNSDPQVLKMVDTGLFATYFLFGIAIISILYFEVAKMFK